ncbi:MAG: DUF5989 family protein [Anaeromyxobacteraceae bacterium]
MIKRPGKLRRTWVMLANAGPAIADGARGVWRSGPGRKWLTPLFVFLCATGLILALAATVEALSPFLYAIF